MRPHGRARISRLSPEAQAVCDRCGFRFAHAALRWQYQWNGPKLQNLRILVCDGCYDTPQEQLRTILIPPDPVPIMNPRPEQFTSDDNPISPIGWDPGNLFRLTGLSSQSTTFGTLTGGGGPDAAFFGGPTKMFVQAATLTPSSTASAGNVIGKNWSAMPGAMPAYPAGFGPIPQSYVISQAVVAAPVNAAFLGSSTPTSIRLDGSSDGVNWTTLATAATVGSRGETITLTSSVATFYGWHRIALTGDGVRAVAIASIALSAAGPSGAQTASEISA
jgi:hypothetical protein